MKNLVTIIKEGVNDMHPKQNMGRRAARHSIDDKRPAKSARATVKVNPNSSKASYGQAGHSSYWD